MLQHPSSQPDLARLARRAPSLRYESHVKDPFECSTLTLREIFLSDNYIAPVHKAYSIVSFNDETRNTCLRGFVIQLYDRSTLKLVNAISVPGNAIPRVDFVGDSVLIHRNLEKGNQLIIFWNRATGKVLTWRPPSQSVAAHVFYCVSNSIVLLKGDGYNAMASVYRYESEMSSPPELIASDEPLHMFYGCTREARPKVINGYENLECFGILGRSSVHEALIFVLQLRSKRDFSLQSELVENYPMFNFSSRSNFLLSDRFVFADDFNGKWLNVFALVGGSMRKVYAFKKPPIMCWVEAAGATQDIAVFADFVVVYCTRLKSAAIWKVPADFIETCARHLEEGTVGTILEWDQLVRHDDFTPCENNRHSSEKPYCCMKVDPRGVTVVRSLATDPSRVIHVTVLNSIVSDEKH